MGTYKHISRFRSSRMIGRDLAHFYMSVYTQNSVRFVLVIINLFNLSYYLFLLFLFLFWDIFYSSTEDKKESN